MGKDIAGDQTTVVLSQICYRYCENAPEKLRLNSELIAQTLDVARQNRPIRARDLATDLGKVAALRRSHGSVVHVMSRSMQHDLGINTLW